MQVMVLFGRDKAPLVTSADALPGRPDPISVPEFHAVFPDRRMTPVWAVPVSPVRRG